MLLVCVCLSEQRRSVCIQCVIFDDYFFGSRAREQVTDRLNQCSLKSITSVSCSSVAACLPVIQLDQALI